MTADSPKKASQTADPAVLALQRVQRSADKSNRLPKRTTGYSGAHRDRRDPTTLGESLTSWVSETNSGVHLTAATLTNSWSDIVGELVAKHVRIVSLDDGVLQLKGDSPAWDQQATFLAQSIKKSVNERIPGAIQSVRLVQETKKSAGRLRVRQGKRR